MPTYPPRNEPIRKVEIFGKRVLELQKCKDTNSSEEKIANKAEKVRTAKLNLIKARLALLKSYKGEDETDSKLKLIEKLTSDLAEWELLPVSEIIDVVCD